MDEVEYLRQGETVVTSTRIEIGKQTFAVRNVGSVKVTKPGLPWIAAIVALVGVVMAANPDSRGAGFVVAAIAGVWIWQQTSTRSLVLVSGGGEVVALTSKKAAQVEALRAAIAQAIAVR